MTRVLTRLIRNWSGRSLLLLFSVLVVSAAFGLFLSAAATIKATVDQDLAQYWRSTYDILVRPQGSRSKIEEEHGLVQANFLTNIPGGITMEQFEAIRSIPGVEVAAPVAMIGYSQQRFTFLAPMPEPGIYDQYQTAIVETGAETAAYDTHSYVWVYVPSTPSQDLAKIDPVEEAEFWASYEAVAQRPKQHMR
ncbi:MAG: hypothetical protein P1P76_12500 [Anaerolineales bacterium]|nr:hypothetical protein [Anaerolineales bacterium]